MVSSSIITTAIKNLRDLSGLDIDFHNDVSLPTSDGVLTISLLSEVVSMVIELKSEVKAISPTFYLRFLMMQKLDFGLILIANYISPGIKKELVQKGIHYLETSGNCHVQHGNLFIHVEGKETHSFRQSDSVKIYRTSSMKIIINLLANPSLVNSNYRDISAESNVALSSIGKTLRDLEKLGFLLEEDSERKLLKTKTLYDTWLEFYQTALKQKYLVGRFNLNGDKVQLPDNEKWYMSALKTPKDAANSRKFTLYTDVNLRALKSKFHLSVDDKGGIEVVRPYWNDNNSSIVSESSRVVHKILNYADLLTNSATKDDAEAIIKNREMIETLYGKNL